MAKNIRQHYIPQFHLNYFCDKSKTKKTLHCWDVESGRYFNSSPRDIAVVKHLTRVEGEDPDAIDKSFTEIETRAGLILPEIMKTQSIPVNDDYNSLIDYITLLVVRNQPLLKSQDHSVNEALTGTLKDITKNVTDEDVAEICKKEGIAPILTEQLKSFVYSQDYRIQLHQNHRMEILIDSFNNLWPCIHTRKWFIAESQDLNNKFIISDRPVVLRYVNGNNQQMPPGFATPDTMIILPVSPESLLVGVFEDLKEDVKFLDCDKNMVACYNMIIGTHASMQIYSSTLKLLAVDLNGKIGSQEDIFEFKRILRQKSHGKI